jgi:predicted metal-dependent hydrolase
MLRNIRLQLQRLVKPPRRRRVKQINNKDYLQKRELTRALINKRIKALAPICQVTIKRVFIKNQRRRWGSCSALGNLNFSYKLIYLPACLRDFIHELCHLRELNHSQNFWNLVAEYCPEYKSLIATIRRLEKSTNLKPEALEAYAITHTCQYCQAELLI